MKLSLRLPVSIGARIVVFTPLDAATEAIRKVAGGEEEALHDFRRSLRRTRDALESWWEHLPAKASTKLRGRLEEVQRSIGATRETEMAIAWLSSVESDLGSSTAVGRLVAELSARLESRENDYEDLRFQFDRVRRKLVDELRIVELDLLSSNLEATFGETLATHVIKRFTDLRVEVARICERDGRRVKHVPRAMERRLRYALEVVPEEPTSGRVVDRLERFSALAREINDAFYLAACLEQAKDSALDPVRERNNERSARLLETLEIRWRDAELAELGVDIDKLSESLQASA